MSLADQGKVLEDAAVMPFLFMHFFLAVFVFFFKLEAEFPLLDYNQP